MKRIFILIFVIIAVILIAINTFFGDIPLIETYDGVIAGLSYRSGFFAPTYEVIMWGSNGTTYIARVPVKVYAKLQLGDPVIFHMYHFKGAIVKTTIKVRTVIINNDGVQRECSIL